MLKNDICESKLIFEEFVGDFFYVDLLLSQVNSD